MQKDEGIGTREQGSGSTSKPKPDTPKVTVTSRHGGILIGMELELSSLCWTRLVPNEVSMQVFCKSTNGNAETRCCVCGQGFVMFWERQSRHERVAALHEIQETLRRHHRVSPSSEAHPTGSFPVPERDATMAFAGAILSAAGPNLEL